MLAKSPEKRLRQKPKRRMCGEVNPEAALEYFQISVNILEARNLVWSNSQTVNTYVVVMLGKEKYRTHVRKNMDETRYKEYLLFEWYTTMRELQQAKLWLGVMEPRCYAPPRLLGEATIDLGVIWAQTNHQVFHKWAQLRLPRDPAAGTVGFLKLDISILCRGDVQAMPVMVSEEEEQKHKHSVITACEQQTANYIVTVYSAFGIFGVQSQVERKAGKLPSTYVKVSFCGLTAKTAVRHNSVNPQYCEQICITEAFPNICQTVHLEVCTAGSNSNKILARVELNLAHISHDGENGFVPTFGPSLLYMYGSSADIDQEQVASLGEDGPFYRGAILVALKLKTFHNIQTECRTTSVEPVAPLLVDNLWYWDEICIFCPILEVSMLDRQLSGNLCGAAVTIGEINLELNDEGEFTIMKKSIRKRKLHYTGPLNVVKSDNRRYGYLSFLNAFPVLQLATHQPDFKFRMYRNNMVRKMALELESTLAGIVNMVKKCNTNWCGLLDEIQEAIERTAGDILKFLDAINCESAPNDHGDGEHYTTELDRKRLALQKEELEKMYHQLTDKIKSNSPISLMKMLCSDDNCIITKKQVKSLVVETMVFAKRIKSLADRGSEGWPDIVLWLLNDGSRYAYCKINPSDVIFSEIAEQSGNSCGQIQTVYMKPLKCTKHITSSECSCIAGKIEFIFWMGSFAQKSALECFMPNGFNIRMKEYDMCIKAETLMLECCVYIHRAKIITADSLVVPSPFVRVNALSDTKDSKVENKTSLPVWNQVITLKSKARSSVDRLEKDPPKIMVEMYNSIGSSELIGRLECEPLISIHPSNNYAPPLRWYDLLKDHETAGQILLSAKIRLVPETLIKSTTYGSLSAIDEAQENTETERNEIDELPLELRPKYYTYKVDIYWWGLRDVNCIRKPCAILEIDNLIVKSDVIQSSNVNCNFPNARISLTFQSHLEESYSPPLTIKLYDSSTFGRTIFLGTKTVKNPTKYLVEWLTKYERDMCLNIASFTSNHFLRVNDTLFVKKSDTSRDINTEISKITVSSSLVDRKKWSTWKRLLCRKEPDEEEDVLLPMYVRERNQLKIMRKHSESDYQDWWSRFFASQKVYDTELENQPEFQNFKDWCRTLKLYSGKKTGMPSTDEGLLCGYLKAGIAIYRWPPPSDVVAVNSFGVHLNDGFYNDYPSNDPSKFLIRVYAIRGLYLSPKDFNGKCDPYVVVKCGSKQVGDRAHFLQNTVNPVFGRIHEFRCSLPEDYLLTVSVLDHDPSSQDTLIGTTNIDLEDRIYSKHRGSVGLSATYDVTGTAKWRDVKKPSDILEEICRKNNLPPPKFPDGNTVVVNGVEYRDSDKSNKTYISASEKKENICLYLLHKWHTLPLCGYHLVPEHVETRRLYNPEKPGLEQGKIQMWVDIFPLHTGLYVPMPVDITPLKIEDYELRVIVWHVRTLGLNGVSPNKGLDLYVKAWIGDIEQAHYTDIHYNCLNGDANFNWRMIFDFQYQHSEKKLIKIEKGPFTEVEEHLPPLLTVQVADSDASIDECLATLKLDLNAIPEGTKNIQKRAYLNEISSQKTNLFSAKSIRSWWPLKAVDQKAESKLAGMIDLEMHLLPKHKALVMPAGLGRNPPFPLPEPNRPEAHPNVKKIPLKRNFCNRKGAEYVATGVIVSGILLLGGLFFWEVPIILSELPYY